MMGRQRRQVSFKDIQVWADRPVVPLDSFYGQMAAFGEKLITEESFAKLYAERGRPSVPPALLSKVLLLMFHDNVTDREAEERARYDLRWKAALGLGIDEVGFDATSLCRFRARLLLHQKEGTTFEETVKTARNLGLLSEEVAEVVDSTLVLGAGAVQDTYTLLRSAMRQMLKTLHKRADAPKLSELLKRKDYGEEGKPDIDWNDPAARQALLNEFVQDARTVLRETGNLELDSAESAARELLAAVTEQDIEEQPDGTVGIKQGVAKDRVISTSDPEMRHGHKSSKGRFDGHKAHIMEDPQSEIITAVAATAGNVPDAEPLPELLDQQTEMGIKVTEVKGDTAYGSGDTRADLATREIRLVAPVPPEPKGEFLPKSAFEIDLEAQTCRCPAGHVVKMTGIRKKDKAGSFHFGEFCQGCPLRPKCTKGKRGRSVTVHRHEALLQKGRAEQKTEAFKAEYRQRPIVERKIAELTHHGIHQARYRGKAKVRLQLAWTAAMVNLKRIFTTMAGGTAPKKQSQTALAA